MTNDQFSNPNDGGQEMHRVSDHSMGRALSWPLSIGIWSLRPAAAHAVGTGTFSSLAAWTICPQVSSSMKMPFLRRSASILASGSPG